MENNKPREVSDFLIRIGFTIPQMIRCLRHLKDGVSFYESMNMALSSKDHFVSKEDLETFVDN